MADKAPDASIHAIVGALLILDALVIGYAPVGPWDSSSFTIGIIGVTGLCMWYVAWYRLTFKRKGLIPWLDQWQTPKESSPKVFALGIATIALAWASGNPLQEYLPNPTGLVLMLVGLLISLSGIYVMLSTGPLAD